MAILLVWLAVAARAGHRYGGLKRPLRGVGRLLSRRFGVLLVLISATYAAVFLVIKRKEQEQAIETFQRMELYDARQLGQNLEREIKIIQAQLRVIARNGRISQFDDLGVKVMRSNYKLLDQRWVRSLSRVSQAGRIQLSLPNETFNGADVSSQSHNQVMIRERRQLVSEPFLSIQGFQAIAVTEPVFDSKNIFTGWLTALIDFKAMLAQFIRPITTGGLSQVDLINNSGRILLDLEGLQSRSSDMVFVNNSSDAQALVRRLLNSEEGTLRYAAAGPRTPAKSQDRASAFSRVRLGDGKFWVIGVSASVADILNSFPVVHWPELLAFALFLAMVVLAATERLRDERRYAATLEREIASRVEELRCSEQAQVLLAHVVEQSAEAIFLVDTRGLVQYVNPAFTTLTGLSREAILGRNVRVLIRDRAGVARFREILGAVAAGAPWTGMLVNRRPDGAPYEVEAIISPVRDASGQILQYVAVNRDVTLEHTLEAQLRQSQKMEAIGKLAGGVAHDFNNVLTAIVGNLQLAQRLADERLQKYLKDALTASERATAMVRQLLTFSRKSQGVRQAVDLNPLVHETVRLVEKSVDRRIRLVTHLADPLPPVTADPNQIHQVIMNLCVNARDAINERIRAGGAHGPDGGQEYRITMLTRVETIGEEYCRLHSFAHVGRFVSLTVGDEGIGMDRETLVRIFEPFFTTKGAGQGTGLGLSTVYGIVKNHNGWVHVASERGAGAVFKVYLPVAEDHQPAPPDAPRQSEAVAGVGV